MLKGTPRNMSALRWYSWQESSFTPSGRSCSRTGRARDRAEAPCCHLDRVPRRNDVAARGGVVLERVDDLGNLIDRASVGVGQERHCTPYTGPKSPFSSAHSSQMVTPRSCNQRTFEEPRRNHSDSIATDLSARAWW